MRYFKGHYYKHQQGKQAIAFITGRACDYAFIQVITRDHSYNFNYPLDQCSRKLDKIGDCTFTSKGIKINIHQDGHRIQGFIRYGRLTPLKYPIMGPFCCFPMQCCHTITSLWHRIKGTMKINDKEMHFTNGRGYIEGDSGCSFPKNYTWIQCNAFKEKASISVAIADIPFIGLHFTGCIAVVYIHGREYRLATYLGVRILKNTDKELLLKQGNHLLKITYRSSHGQSLNAPTGGQMDRTITEQLCCPARFQFYHKGTLIFDQKSRKASVERIRK